MKVKFLLLASLMLAGLCSCGSSSKVASDSAAASQLDMQTDPIVIELDSFENRPFSGERSYITIYQNTIKGLIPSVVGMVRTGMATGTHALKFNQDPAVVSSPRPDKKGRCYSFSVIAKDGEFFNSRSLVDWRLSFTVYGDGSVTMYIESDAIQRVFQSRTWMFRGHVNNERTEALKLIDASNPQE